MFQRTATTSNEEDSRQTGVCNQHNQENKTNIKKGDCGRCTQGIRLSKLGGHLPAVSKPHANRRKISPKGALVELLENTSGSGKTYSNNALNCSQLIGRTTVFENFKAPCDVVEIYVLRFHLENRCWNLPAIAARRALLVSQTPFFTSVRSILIPRISNTNLHSRCHV